jgi:hypothetical protein
LFRPPPVCLQQLLAALDDAPQVGHLADRRTRVNSMQEQQLRSIEGAKACQISLIKQSLADRAVRLSGKPSDCLVEIPIRPEQIRSEMSDNRVLSSRRNELDDRKPISDRIMITRGQDGANLKCRSSTPAPSPRIDLPHPIHLEMCVEGELVAEPEQLVLTARNYLAYANAGQIGRRQSWHTKFRSRQHAAGKHLVQPLACPPDGISLGHGLIVPLSCARRKSRAQRAEEEGPVALLPMRATTK